MIRLAGALMICIVCIMYGFAAADRLKKRRDFLSAFVTSLPVLETEIAFGKNSLDRIFAGLGDTKPLCGLYDICRENMKDYGIRRAWELAADKAADSAGLDNDAKAAVISLGAELGMSDARGQKKAIERTRELAAVCADKAEKEYTRLGRTYRLCGTLTGIACVIALW